MTPKRRLIVTADDFGLSPAVNAGVLQAHREGVLTAASLLVNAPAFDEAARLAAEVPRLAVGVHLNIVRGRPISKPAGVSSLVDAGGLFLPFRRRRMDREFLAHAEREYAEQITRALAAGVKPTHLDFEKHHAWQKPLYDVALRLAAEYAVPRVRNLSEPVWWSIRNLGWPGIRRLCMASLLRAGTAPLRPGEGLGGPDRLLGPLHSGLLDETRWLRLLDRLPGGTSEVMTHPGLAGDGEAMGKSWIDGSREAELRALISPRVRERVAELGVKLVGVY